MFVYEHSALVTVASGRRLICVRLCVGVSFMPKKSFAPRRMASVLLALSLWLSLFISPIGTPTVATAADDLPTTGQWAPVINWQIFGKHMALLPNGKVLAWPTGADAFLWDPITQ